MIRALLKWHNPQSSKDRNDQLRDVHSKGIYSGGVIQVLPGQLAVKLTKFVVVSLDGMTLREDDVDTIVPVQPNLSQRIVLRARFVIGGDPIAQLEIMPETAYQSDPEKPYLISFGLLNVPPAATEVLPANLDLTKRDTIDAPWRSPWRPAVASAGALPTLPGDIRRGDRTPVLDTLQEFVWSGTSWIPIDPAGILNLVDGRFAFPGLPGSAPRRELGRVADSFPDRAPRVVRVFPVHHQLSPVQAADADLTEVLAGRTLKRAGNVLYVKNRNAASPGTVEIDDLRIGPESSAPGFFVQVVDVGDSDVGTVLGVGTLSVAAHDGDNTYFYLQPGGPAAIAAGDVRLWQAPSANPERLGLAAGGALVAVGDPDIGDPISAGFVYSRTAPSPEDWYASTVGAQVAVTVGQTRLTQIANANYNKAKQTIVERSDRGAVRYAQPTLAGVETDFDLDSAHPLNGGLPGYRFREAGVSSPFMNKPTLSTLAGGQLGPGSIQVADGLHVHALANMDDGIVSGGAVSNGGGLNANVTGAVVWALGASRAPAPAVLALTNAAINYVFAQASGVVGAAFASTTVAATALNTPGNIPVARVTTAGGVITLIEDIREFVQNAVNKTVLTVGNDPARSHFTSMASAIAWVHGYLADGVAPKDLELRINGDCSLPATVSLAGVAGLTIRGPARRNQAVPDLGMAPAVRWSFDGAAFDLGGSADITFDGVQFTFEGTNPAFTSATCFGDASALATGGQLTIRNCTTIDIGAQNTKLRFFLRFTTIDALRLVVENCDADVTNSGIVVANAEHCVFRGNRFVRNGTQSGSVTATAGIQFTGATVRSCLVAQNLINPKTGLGAKTGGQGFFQGITFTNETLDTQVVDNQIDHASSFGGGAVGIHFGSTVRGNIIRSADSGPIGIDMEQGALVEGNRILFTSTAAAGGLAACINNSDGAGGVISGNHCQCAIPNATIIDGQVDSLTISGNFVTGSTAVGADQIGISLGSNSTASGNYLISIGSITGFAIFSGGTRNTIVGNTMSASISRGIRLAGDECNVVGNVVVTSGKALDITGSKCQTTGNDLISAGTGGASTITVNASPTGVVISGNRIENTGAGAPISGGASLTFVITGNQIKMQSVGITLNGSGSFSGNQFNAVAVTGVLITVVGATGLSIVGNVIAAGSSVGGVLAISGSSRVQFSNNVANSLVGLSTTVFALSGTNVGISFIANNMVMASNGGVTTGNEAIFTCPSTTSDLVFCDNQLTMSGTFTTWVRAVLIDGNAGSTDYSNNTITWTTTVAAGSINHTRVQNTSATGIRILGNALVITANAGATTNGLVVAVASGEFVIEGNFVSIRDGFGMDIADGQVICNSNRVLATNGSGTAIGIDVEAGVNDLTCIGNIVTGSFSSGITTAGTGKGVVIGNLTPTLTDGATMVPSAFAFGATGINRAG